jgi:PAS domain-containing protein
MSQIVNESCFEDSPSGKRKNQNNTVEEGAPQMSRRRAGSMSDSVQPMQDVQRTVGHTSTASPHLPDSLRALYFAPVAMLVLDQKSTFVMVNGLAEGLLGVDSQTCIGQAWDSLLPLTSQETLKIALNEATEKFSNSTARLFTPLSTRIEIEQTTKESTWIDLSIAVWHQSQTLSTHCREEGKREEKAGHELFFTLTLSSGITNPTKDNNTVPPCDTNSNKVIHGDTKSDIIYEFVLQDLSLAMLACDKQGKIVERNKASDDFWSLLGPAPTKSTDEWGEKDWDKNEFDLSWVVDMADFFDEYFQEPFPPCDWPVYRCAILGESSPPVLMGIRLKSSGIQYVVEAIGYPVRDKNGMHIGGVVTFRNVSAEKERLRIEAEQQGDLHFQQTCNSMPQLTFVTDPMGKSEWG